MSLPEILAIAIIGPHDEPLFVRGYTQRDTRDHDGELPWHFLIHSSLDVFDERDSALQASNKPGEAYLGLIRITNECALYGYQSTTQVKFIIAFSLLDTLIRDQDVKAVFRAIHNAYIGHLQNPFSSFDLQDSLIPVDEKQKRNSNQHQNQQQREFYLPIKSAKFARMIDLIARKGEPEQQIP